MVNETDEEKDKGREPEKDKDKQKKEKRTKDKEGARKDKDMRSKKVSFPVSHSEEEALTTHPSIQKKIRKEKLPVSAIPVTQEPLPTSAALPELNSVIEINNSEERSVQSQDQDEAPRVNFLPPELLVIDRQEDGVDELGGIPMLPGQAYNEVGRLHWANNMDFLLSLIGFAVDTANVWGFSNLCLKYGGGSFMIPYTIILVFCVIPVLYMELIMGQFVQQGTISVWKLCPFFKGVGWCMVMVSSSVSFVYNVVLAWSLIYIYESVAYSNIRWMSCNETWVTSACTHIDSENATKNTSVPSAKEFFKRYILKVESGYNTTRDLYELGPPDPQLAISLLFVYIFLFTCLIFGIKVTGKVVWVTATVPYIVLGLLLFRGITLPGSSTGLLQFVTPHFELLFESRLWADAAVQVFYSAGAGFGVHQSYASFNRFHHHLFRDCIVTMLVNTGTSILAGMVIFSYLGNVAYSTRQNISNLARPGPELVFEVFPTAIGRLPGANFFSCMFFLMLFLIGIDSAFVYMPLKTYTSWLFLVTWTFSMVQPSQSLRKRKFQWALEFHRRAINPCKFLLGAINSITTAISDEYQAWFTFHPRLRPSFIFGCVAIFYLIGLLQVTQGGIFVFQILYDTAGTVALIAAVFLQIVAISYVYGLRELCDHCEAMTGRRPGIFFNICWKFITPGILFILLVNMMDGVLHHVPSYEMKEVPHLGYVIGLFVGFTPILIVPCVAIYSIFSTPNVSLCMKFKLAITPDHEYDQVLNSGITERTSLRHLVYFEHRMPELPDIRRITGIFRRSRVAPA